MSIQGVKSKKQEKNYGLQLEDVQGILWHKIGVGYE